MLNKILGDFKLNMAERIVKYILKCEIGESLFRKETGHRIANV